MKDLKVIGKEQVAGYEFIGIEGGFGDGTRGMLVRDIAEIHGTTVKRINELIKKNIMRFKNGVDIVNLKDDSVVVLNDLEFTQNAINRYKYIYLLSERGYSKLLKILEDDTAWDIYDKFVDGYFNMRQHIKEQMPMTDLEKIALLAQGTTQLSERIEKVDSKLDNLIENQALNATDYGSVNRAVNHRVYAYASIHHIPKSNVGPLFKDLGNQIKQVANVGNRSRIKSKDYDMVIKFIDNWEPSTATKTIIEQTELDVEKSA
ncbi:ORF6N domain-containing protein [Leuconostoc citreum]|uniref:ORF6N domain-containing protein n=1 Tax=Leuconostoc citreum TaxID=33964 RepID=UPI00217545E4|nr:ORF6C domain-containing protein [Leuconostoc citreum]